MSLIEIALAARDPKFTIEEPTEEGLAAATFLLNLLIEHALPVEEVSCSPCGQFVIALENGHELWQRPKNAMTTTEFGSKWQLPNYRDGESEFFSLPTDQDSLFMALGNTPSQAAAGL